MNKKAVLGFVTVAGLTLTLAACGGGKDNSKDSDKGGKTADTSQFKLKTDNKKEAIKDGTLEIGVISDTAFTGIFNDAFSSITLDSTFFSPANEGLFNNDKDLKMKDGAAKIKFDEDAKKVTIAMKDGVKWSDGKDVTADDLEFPYLVIGNKDYDGVRYDSTMKNIVGMEEYHDGKSDSVSGIKKVDGKTIEITYKEFSPAMLQNSNSGVLGYAMPKHTFDGIAVKDMAASDPVRKHPITFGPFVMTKITPGESVEFEANKNYYGGEPKLKKIIMKTLPTSSATASMKAKEFDLYRGMPTAEFQSWKDLPGYQIVGQQDTAYDYIGFKMGKYDKEKGVNVYDSKAKMADKSLRQAMGYAIDNAQIAQSLYHGLKTPANSLIVPAFGTKYDKDLKGYTHDVKKANKLLDDAGYKKGSDGIRTDKEGKKLEINFAFRDNGAVADKLSKYYIQAWKEVGLDVKLATGRLIEVNSFYDKIQADDPSIDVFQAGWSTGFDPGQSGLYGDDAKFNFSRFVSDENTKLLKAMDSKDAFDDKKAAKIWKDWQDYANEQAFVLPTTYTMDVTPVSERVTGYDITRNLDYNVYAKLGVTSDKR